ncbi:MAG: hypothetical protein H6741_03660 [Alphaproteobacteria bacterium]|nr:hypothetical protein [Alphaproteobacteria bacterium]
MRYGPPPDPRQELLPLSFGDEPALWLGCVALGLALMALALIRRQPEGLRAWWVCLGGVVTLTSPLALVLSSAIYGAWPTIDKTGSLLFYLEGVHRTVTLTPWEAASDPAARLIGVHVGHLWITAFFDLFLEPFAAFNAQALLYPALGWWAAALFAKALTDRWEVALPLGFPFGMGLHVFRDLNWYTIEKAAVGFLALFAWATLRAWQEGGHYRWMAGGLYVLMAFVNWYLALVGAAAGALALGVSLLAERGLGPRSRGLAWACVSCSLMVLPLVALQLSLLQGPGTLGDPERFLMERAIPDSFTLSPPMWNRLELWRALNGAVLGLAAWALLRRDRLSLGLGAVAGGLFLLALGPQLWPGVMNPLYMGIRAAVPGFWRVAKPEVFFEGTWLLLIGVAALQLQRLPGRRPLLLLPVFMLGWALIVRTHPVFPAFSAPLEVQLDPNWARNVGIEAPSARP